jgi:hypothetical protein
MNDFEMTPADARDAALVRLAYELNETAQRAASGERTEAIERLLRALALANGTTL